MKTRAHRRTLWLPLGLTWLAFSLRIYHLTFQSLWRDEVDTLLFATRPLSHLLATFTKVGENGPLFFLGMRPWLALAGHSEYALRFPSALLGALAVPVVFSLVRRLAGERPALAAGLLMATGPYLVWYGQEAKMYALLTVLIPASLLLAVEAVRRGRWWRWALLYIVTSLSFYTHLLAALIVPVQAVWLLILAPWGVRPGSGGIRRRWLHVFVYLILLLAPYLPLMRWQAPMWLSGYETGHPFVSLADLILVLRVAFVRGILPADTPATLWPALLGLVAGVTLWPLSRSRATPGDAGRKQLLRSRSAPTGSVVLLAIWLLLPPVALYLVSLGMPLFLDRYLIWIMPAFLALIGLGVIALHDIWQPVGLAVLGAIVTLNLADVAAQANQPVKADFRAAAAFVTTAWQPGDLLLFQIPYNRHTFTYYSGDAYPWTDGPFTNAGMSEPSLDAEMRQATAAALAVWLVDAEAEMWDERGLTQVWLAAHGRPIEQAKLTRVTVTRYVLEKQKTP